MSLLSRALGRALGLPRRNTSRVVATRGIAVPMSDGVTLRADQYDPGLPAAATVLVRTPYGRGGPVRWFATAVAERGFHVVVQSCRGTFDSGGEFEPMRNERSDGLDTLTWLAGQPWYSGELCTYGPSYVGFVQWALAGDAGPQLKAMATVVTASQFRDATYPGGSFSLDTVLTWSALINAQRGPRMSNLIELARGQPKLHRGLRHLPLREADLIATGAQVAFYREWLTHVDPADQYWRERGHRERVAEIGVPVLMVGGWHDIFLPWQLEDYATLRAAGARPYLTIGPWTHGSFGLLRAATAEAITWFRAYTGTGDRSRLCVDPVRIFVTGQRRWRDLPDWPPPSRTREWYLHGGGGLGTEAPPGQASPDRFVYDPADPTPALGGPRLIANRAGPRDNRPIEARRDVLVYTGDPLAAPVEVIGPVSATLFVRADGEYFDVFVRLCDVAPSGRSVNLCDGLVRVLPGRFPPDRDGIRRIEVPLWPTAHRFLPGHRIRVQVSGGAHPRFARNPGTGALLGQESELRPVAREVFATAGQPSAVHLPVVSG